MSNHLPICSHPLFTQDQQYPTFSTWASQSLYRFAQRFGKTSPLYQDLTRFKLPTHHLLYIHQTTSFVASMCPSRNVRFKTWLLDMLLEWNLHKTSDLYKPLTTFFKTSICSSTPPLGIKIYNPGTLSTSSLQATRSRISL